MLTCFPRPHRCLCVRRSGKVLDSLCKWAAQAPVARGGYLAKERKVHGGGSQLSRRLIKARGVKGAKADGKAGSKLKKATGVNKGKAKVNQVTRVINRFKNLLPVKLNSRGKGKKKAAPKSKAARSLYSQPLDSLATAAAATQSDSVVLGYSSDAEQEEAQSKPAAPKRQFKNLASKAIGAKAKAKQSSFMGRMKPRRK